MSIGLYGKKVLFFAGVLLILGVGVYFFSQQFSSASVNEATYERSTNQYVMDIDIEANADVLVNGKKVSGLMSIGENFDEFKYVALSEEGTYIDNIVIRVHLPEPQEGIEQNVYAVHGIESYNYYQQDAQTLIYEAKNLSPVSTFTIVALLPKGMVTFSLYSRAIFTLSNLSPTIWIAVSLALPLLTLILLFWLFQEKISDWWSPKVEEQFTEPPSDLSPGEVEVLLNGKISSRSIAATLLAMAQKGYIHIVQRDDDFSFGRRNLYDPVSQTFNKNLTEPEKILASKIFTQEELRSRREDILMRVGRHVFSRKVAEVYIAFYDSVAQKGYFKENPAEFHKRYYVIGLILFFIAFIGFIFGIWVAPEPNFMLVFWFMMMMSALLIVRVAPQLPLRTKLGKEEAVKWKKFKNYLSSSQPIDQTGATQEVFEKYLPYAITMGCEVEWAKRFIDQPFKLPNWYSSERHIALLEDFMAGVLPMVGFVSRSLVAAKEPIVH